MKKIFDDEWHDKRQEGYREALSKKRPPPGLIPGPASKASVGEANNRIDAIESRLDIIEQSLRIINGSLKTIAEKLS